jgi:hypothetical protein
MLFEPLFFKPLQSLKDARGLKNKEEMAIKLNMEPSPSQQPWAN